MPDESGSLTPEDIKILQEWWGIRWKEPVICPVCKTGAWSYYKHVLAQYRVAADGFIAPPVYPMVGVSCLTCGYLMLFNGVALGICEGYQEPAAPEPFENQPLASAWDGEPLPEDGGSNG
jgi:hypothetical protein